MTSDEPKSRGRGRVDADETLRLNKLLRGSDCVRSAENRIVIKVAEAVAVIGLPALLKQVGCLELVHVAGGYDNADGKDDGDQSENDEREKTVE